MQGLFSYPGIPPSAIESVDFTDLSGVAPAICIVQIYLERGFPLANGDAVFSYNGNTMTIAAMHVDSVSFHAGSGGRICTVRLLDERWAWAFYSITGNYNLRFPNGLIDPAHEKKPQELATLLFQAMGVVNYDVSALPNDARPPADWDHVNAASELAQLVDSLGCRLVCQRSTGKWIVCVTGVGASLPTDLPIQDPGQGVNPKPLPDYLRIVTAPFNFQVQLQLTAIARDIDRSWKSLDKLSYKPNPAPGGNFLNSYGNEFGCDPSSFADMLPAGGTRAVQPDGTFKSPIEFALESVFRCYRIDDQPNNVEASTSDDKNQFYLPGYRGFVTRKQLIVSNELVESYTDDLDVDHRRPSYVSGSFYTFIEDNKPAGTRIDYQARTTFDQEEAASFNISIDPLDTDRTIWSFSKPMVIKYPIPVDGSGVPISDQNPYAAASLFATCAVQVRDPVTWQPVRYEKLLQIGNGTNTNFCQTITQEDIQPWLVAQYDSSGECIKDPDFSVSDNSLSGAYLGGRTNRAEVDQLCDYYLTAYAQTFQIVVTQSNRYIGLFPIDMDGSICQVQYTIDKSGATTIASSGTEHHFYIPTAEQRLQQIATRSKASLAGYEKYRAERRLRLLGTSNTI